MEKGIGRATADRKRWGFPLFVLVTGIGIVGLIATVWLARAETRQLVVATEWRARPSSVVVSETERAMLSQRESEIVGSTRGLDRVLLVTGIGSTIALGLAAATLVVEIRRRCAAQTLERAAAAEVVSVNRRLEDANRALERAVADLNGANAGLLAANSELETFAYSVSHDLRAPLRSIDGFSRALLEDAGDRLEPEHRAHLDRVRAAARRMGDLIDDLLGLSRVTRQPLRIEDVDLEAIARSVADELHAASPARDVAMTVGPLPRVRGDARLLRVAMTNLLSNAWKYTAPREKAVVDVSGRTSPEGGEVTVGDNGVGFDPAYAHKLFGVFQRLHGAHEFEGTGIGLATVRRIVARHGGRVWADGRVGEGARFHLVLPLADRSGEAPA